MSLIIYSPICIPICLLSYCLFFLKYVQQWRADDNDLSLILQLRIPSFKTFQYYLV